MFESIKSLYAWVQVYFTVCHSIKTFNTASCSFSHLLVRMPIGHFTVPIIPFHYHESPFHRSNTQKLMYTRLDTLVDINVCAYHLLI